MSAEQRHYFRYYRNYYSSLDALHRRCLAYRRFMRHLAADERTDYARDLRSLSQLIRGSAASTQQYRRLLESDAANDDDFDSPTTLGRRRHRGRLLYAAFRDQSQRFCRDPGCQSRSCRVVRRCEHRDCTSCRFAPPDLLAGDLVTSSSGDLATSTSGEDAKPDVDTRRAFTDSVDGKEKREYDVEMEVKAEVKVEVNEDKVDVKNEANCTFEGYDSSSGLDLEETPVDALVDVAGSEDTTSTAPSSEEAARRRYLPAAHSSDLDTEMTSSCEDTGRVHRSRLPRGATVRVRGHSATCTTSSDAYSYEDGRRRRQEEAFYADEAASSSPPSCGQPRREAGPRREPRREPRGRHRLASTRPPPLYVEIPRDAYRRLSDTDTDDTFYTDETVYTDASPAADCSFSRKRRNRKFLSPSRLRSSGSGSSASSDSSLSSWSQLSNASWNRTAGGKGLPEEHLSDESRSTGSSSESDQQPADFAKCESERNRGVERWLNGVTSDRGNLFQSRLIEERVAMIERCEGAHGIRRPTRNSKPKANDSAAITNPAEKNPADKNPVDKNPAEENPADEVVSGSIGVTSEEGVPADETGVRLNGFDSGDDAGDGMSTASDVAMDVAIDTVDEGRLLDTDATSGQVERRTAMEASSDVADEEAEAVSGSVDITNLPTKCEDRKAEDRKAEDRKAEDRKAEDRKAEDRKAEDRKTEDRKAEDRKTEDRKAEDWKTEDRKAEDRKAEAINCDSVGNYGDTPLGRETRDCGEGEREEVVDVVDCVQLSDVALAQLKARILDQLNDDLAEDEEEEAMDLGSEEAKKEATENVIEDEVNKKKVHCDERKEEVQEMGKEMVLPTDMEIDDSDDNLASTLPTSSPTPLTPLAYTSYTPATAAPTPSSTYPIEQPFGEDGDIRLGENFFFKGNESGSQVPIIAVETTEIEGIGFNNMQVDDGVIMNTTEVDDIVVESTEVDHIVVESTGVDDIVVESTEVDDIVVESTEVDGIVDGTTELESEQDAKQLIRKDFQRMADYLADDVNAALTTPLFPSPLVSPTEGNKEEGEEEEEESEDEEEDDWSDFAPAPIPARYHGRVTRGRENSPTLPYDLRRLRRYRHQAALQEYRSDGDGISGCLSAASSDTRCHSDAVVMATRRHRVDSAATSRFAYLMNRRAVVPASRNRRGVVPIGPRRLRLMVALRELFRTPTHLQLVSGVLVEVGLVRGISGVRSGACGRC